VSRWRLRALFLRLQTADLVLPDGRYFLLVQKVTKNTLKGVQGATPAVSLVAVGAHNDGILMAPP